MSMGWTTSRISALECYDITMDMTSPAETMTKAREALAGSVDDVCKGALGSPMRHCTQLKNPTSHAKSAFFFIPRPRSARNPSDNVPEDALL